MRPAAVTVIAVGLLAGLGVRMACGGTSLDPTLTMLDVPRQDVVMGDDIGRTDWPTRLAHPSAEGQFEVLVRKSATDIQAPACRSAYLVIRMPASVSVGADPAAGAAVARKIQYYDELLAAYNQGRPFRAEVFAGPYGKRSRQGKLVLSQCNLFFAAPKPRG